MPLDPKEIQDILDRCSAALAGHSSEVQGAVLADLLSMWLAGHHVWDDRQATFKLREELLNEHVRAVVQLLPANEAIALERYRKGELSTSPIPGPNTPPKDKPN